MYRFDVAHRGDGGVRVVCGIYYADSERGLARKLVNAGMPDGPVVAGREGRTDYTVKSLHRFAAHSVEEGERGIQIRTYRPHEKATVSLALGHAVSRAECAAKNRREARAATPAPECVENALADA